MTYERTTDWHGNWNVSLAGRNWIALNQKITRGKAMTQLAVQPMQIHESLPFSLEEVARIVGDGPRSGKLVTNYKGLLEPGEPPPT